MQPSAPDVFEEHRKLLEGIAYRMCGVLADAQDIVQETHIKWCAAERSTIGNPKAWLVTVCSRLAVDMRKSARSRREQYVGAWLPEPFLETHGNSPAEQTQTDDSVSVALMLALERLSPAQRAAFILHDIFAYDFNEVAAITGKSESACRKLASRARRAVRERRPKFPASPDTHRQLLDAFFEAVHAGDSENLKTLLTESVELHADGGGRVRTAPEVLSGREAVAGFFLEVWRRNANTPESVRIVANWFNGQPGVLIYQNNQLVAALSLSVAMNRIDRIFALRNPDKLVPFMQSQNPKERCSAGASH